MGVMIKIKVKIITVFIFAMLNGCAQNTALLGPVYTLGATGNIYQAGLSYGSSKTITKVTGKSPTENLKQIIERKKNKNNDDDLTNLVETQIEKTKKLLLLSNQ